MGGVCGARSELEAPAVPTGNKVEPKASDSNKVEPKASTTASPQAATTTTTTPAATTQKPESSRLHLRIIHINDVYELDNFPSFATLVQTMSKSNNDQQGAPDKTLVILGGDFVAPSLLSSLNKGSSMVDCMNAAGITHVCLGNHETDIPTTALAKRIQQSNFVWVNSNLQDLNRVMASLGRKAPTTPEYDIVTVTNGEVSKRVALLGLLTTDPGLYRPGAFGNARMDPVIPTTESLVEELQSKTNNNDSDDEAKIDLFLPLTHQHMHEDREFAQHFGGDLFPLILGGHDHIPFHETVNGSCILKVGMDAVNTGIIDLLWNGNSQQPQISVKMVETQSFEPDPDMKVRVAGHKQILEQLEQARLFKIPKWTDASPEAITPETLSKSFRSSGSERTNVVFSTANNRFGTSTGTSALATMLRMGMRCHVCILNGGCVRANKVYPQDQVYFTWKDLKAEMPFETALAVTCLPGGVLEAMIEHSRRGSFQTPPVASGGYLHHCNNVVYNEETQKIESIMGEAFDPDKEFLVAHPIEFLEGVDNHKPLLDWAKAEEEKQKQQRGNGSKKPMNRLLHEEAARPSKMVIVELFSTLLWLQMGSFADLDVNKDGYITRDEVKQRLRQVFDSEGVVDLVLENVMGVADFDDEDEDGEVRISPLELMVVHYVATDLIHHVSSLEEDRVLRETVAKVMDLPVDSEEVESMAEKVKQRLTTNGNDEHIHRSETMSVLGHLRRASLLVK